MGVHAFVPILVLLVVGTVAEAARTPPGIAKNPSNARCLDNKYKTCYNLVHVCPKMCPDQCTVHCQSCKPICSSAPTTPTYTPPPPPPSPSPPTYPTPPTPSTPTYPTPPTPTPSTPTPTPTPPTPTPPTPTPSTPTPTPPTPTPSTPPTPTPSTPAPTPPTPTPTTPTPTPPTPTPTPSTPTPTPPTPSKAKCSNSWYPQCYNTEHVCPAACPGGCEVDCASCKPVCKCDKPGAVCQDPRFVGGDGITFYFHGKKDSDFCLVSDSNLHINAHFIGRRNPYMKRDFTWVQSIAILFGKHQLFVGAMKTAAWDDSVDRLALSFDGQPILLPESDNAIWQSTSFPTTTIRRAGGSTNNVVVEVEGSFKITAKVVPITEEDSRVHNYGITKEDSMAHLDLGFKFLSLSTKVSGVLGQTYKPDYESRVKVGANMPIMGGDRDFETSTLFAADCSVARFTGIDTYDSESDGLELPTMKCASGIDGRGVVCKR